MTKGLTVLSLFDGISMGRVALERVGIPVEKYYASEIDKHAIAISEKNYQDIIRLGDVCSIKGEDLDDIDVLIGGSPCTSFSNSGTRSGFDGESGLFWEYVRLLKETNPKYFLLENVVMKKEWEDIITEAMGVSPIKINSRTLSAQNRPRLYWTNIPGVVTLTEDSPITVGDILQDESEVAENLFLSEKAIAYMSRLRNGKPRWEHHTNPVNGKAACLTANMHKGVPYGVLKRDGYPPRRLTPIECERLQTLDDNYTEGVSNTARYKAIGNGWTVSVIEHIFKGLIGADMSTKCDSTNNNEEPIEPTIELVTTNSSGLVSVQFGYGGVGIADITDNNTNAVRGVTVVTIGCDNVLTEHVRLTFNNPSDIDKLITRLEETKNRMITND
jgi:site-specific DNA-cytosine methylase